VGFSYRKSVKMGPFRMTASKSGISYSVGGKGARVTKRANGKVQTTLTVPGTGLRYTATSGTGRRQARHPARSSVAPATRQATPVGPCQASRPTLHDEPANTTSMGAALHGPRATWPRSPSTRAESTLSAPGAAGSTATKLPISPGVTLSPSTSSLPTSHGTAMSISPLPATRAG
jgi:hypothetical protein